MFNDILNVREGDANRKKALQKLAAALAANQGRAGGLTTAANRVGGGLGRTQASRFRPMARGNLGTFARLMDGGRADLGNAINRFGLVERQPGAFDPGAIPDLGGIDGQANGGLERSPGVPGPGGTTSLSGNIATDQRTLDPQRSGDPEHQAYASGQTDVDAFNVQSSPQQQGGNYSGYINWQGQMIPVSVYKALMATGELY